MVLTTLSLEDLFEDLKDFIATTIKTTLAENYLVKETVTTNYLSRKEVAKLLGITLPTLHNYSVKGKLTAYRIGSRVLYKPNEVEAALSSFKNYNQARHGN